MKGEAEAKAMVLCLGNSDRGDDGVGPAVAEALRGRLPVGIELATSNGDLLAQIENWSSIDKLICIDAAAPMGEPGRIHRIDLASEGLPTDVKLFSSHSIGLAETIALARTLDLAPKHIVVYAIEGERFETGAPMSEHVASTVDAAVESVAAETAAIW